MYHLCHGTGRSCGYNKYLEVSSLGLRIRYKKLLALLFDASNYPYNCSQYLKPQFLIIVYVLW